MAPSSSVISRANPGRLDARGVRARAGCDPGSDQPLSDNHPAHDGPRRTVLVGTCRSPAAIRWSQAHVNGFGTKRQPGWRTLSGDPSSRERVADGRLGPLKTRIGPLVAMTGPSVF